jgi:signal peptidase I
MAPTVQLTGDIAVVDRWSKKPIQRGEVIAFLSPKDPEKLLMKRVYGLVRFFLVDYSSPEMKFWSMESYTE